MHKDTTADLLLHLGLLVVFIFIPLAIVITFAKSSGQWNETPFESVDKPCTHYKETSK